VGAAAPPAAPPAAPAIAPPEAVGLRRWWVYQRERFPLLLHAPLIGAFTSSAVCLSALLRGAAAPDAASGPGWPAFVAAFGTGLTFFLQLRIADEFKDYDDDARYRPYRPVPRGLVTLRELGLVGAACAAAQLALALWVDVRLVALLAVVWAYMVGMGVEFGVRDWLRRHPLTLLWTHMLVLPLFDLYATAYDWAPARAHVATGIGWFLGASFCNGIVVEVGRKLRAPADEERGVETYSALYGRPRAAAGLLAMMALTWLCAVQVGRHSGHPLLAAVPLGALLAATAGYALWFVRDPRPGRGKGFELLSGVWTLVLYFAIGIVPFLMRFLAGGGR
jgi:4-hydroxybenzoate polyprenyltransferase